MEQTQNQAPEEQTSKELPQAERSPEKQQGELEQRLATLEGSLAQREQELTSLRDQLTLGAAKYRSALLALSPEVPEELVQGQSVQELDESLAKAKRTVEKIRRQIEAKASSERVPAGAPARSAPDLSSLSPQEKITYGLQRSRG